MNDQIFSFFYWPISHWFDLAKIWRGNIQCALLPKVSNSGDYFWCQCVTLISIQMISYDVKWGYFDPIKVPLKVMPNIVLTSQKFFRGWGIKNATGILLLASLRSARPLSDLGWTARPWLDNCPDLRKWKFLQNKETMLSSFVTSEQSFNGSTEHLFLALCFYLVRGTLNLYESSKKCCYALTKYFNIEKCQGLSNEIVCIFEAQMAAKLP